MNWEELNEKRLAHVHPILSGRIKALIESLALSGVIVLVTQGLRTFQEQDRLFAQGRTTPGKIVTNARGGYSHHNYALAVDVCPLDSVGQPNWNTSHKNWQTILEVAPSFKLAEGAKWKRFYDTPHLYPIEIPGDTIILRSCFREGGMKAVNNWFENLVKQNS